MKAKTIKRILNKKHNEFVESIKDEEIRRLVRKNSIITGGAIVSMLLDEPVNDFDYYFTDKETTLKVANYYVDQFRENTDLNVSVQDDDGRIKIIVQSAGVAGEPEGHEYDDDMPEEHKEETEEEGKFSPVFLSTNAISLKGKVQLVIRFYGQPDEIHENYDFIHATCYWRSENNHLSLPREALETILTKELKYAGSKYPLASIFRTRKFIERGWTVNAGQYLKMALQLNELDLHDPKVLEEQLTGVDFAYFQMIIRDIKNKQEKDENFKIDNSYLMTVIARVFD